MRLLCVSKHVCPHPAKASPSTGARRQRYRLVHGDPPCMPPSPPHTQHVCAPQAPQRQALAGQTVRTEESRLRNVTQKPKHAGPALPTVHATVAAAHPACLCALKQRRTAPGTAAARTVKIKQFPPVPPAHRARKQYQAALRTVNTARAATRRPRLRTLKRQNDLTRELPAHRHRNSRSYRRP